MFSIPASTAAFTTSTAQDPVKEDPHRKQQTEVYASRMSENSSRYRLFAAPATVHISSSETVKNAGTATARYSTGLSDRPVSVAEKLPRTPLQTPPRKPTSWTRGITGGEWQSPWKINL